MSKMRLFFLCVPILLLNLSCFEDKDKVKIINEDLFEVDRENEKIKLAVKEAQENLDHFIDKFKQHSQDTMYWFSAKTPFESETMIEHMWFMPLEYESGAFKGILINEPRWVNSVKMGDTIYIDRKNIEDWYISNESLSLEEGGFTDKYLFNE